MRETIEICTSPPFRGERKGEAGRCDLPGIPHLTPTLSALKSGEGEVDIR